MFTNTNYKQNVAVKLKNVSKIYALHNKKPTLSERLINGSAEKFSALRNINFVINRGERVGVIGANGSGKTTLLKLITGITSPTTGYVETTGRVVSLIDLEAGFHPDLSGLQNIYLNGTILGMNKREIDSKIQKIIMFADIGKFIQAPLYTYSSGMSLRLGFAVAINADPDILILDENISVGDSDFSRKSFEKMQEFIKNGKTMILASHNLYVVNDYCKRVLWLKKGRLFADGPAKKIIGEYKS